MTTIIKLHSSITAALESAQLVARNILGDNHKTEEGKLASWAKEATGYKQFSETMAENIAAIRANATKQVNDAWETQFPRATTDTGKLAAEMEAARYLNRGTLKEFGKINQWFKDQDPTPARTIVMDELEETGILDNSQINALIGAYSPEFAAALRNQTTIETILNNISVPQLHSLNAVIANPRDNRGGTAMDISVMGNAPSEVKITSIIHVPAWKPTYLENFYRNHPN